MFRFMLILFLAVLIASVTIVALILELSIDDLAYYAGNATGILIVVGTICAGLAFLGDCFLGLIKRLR